MKNFDPFLQQLTTQPGVYLMLDKLNRVLYVGKAKNLKKRVSNYFKGAKDAKTIQLVNQIDTIEVTVTRNEREALLLESNLIKSEKPRYNVIFRDDKTYPFLQLTIADTYPRLSFYRGPRKKDAKYYGPYPSAQAARHALNLLQSIFKLRQCDNTFFKMRTRPCLQYQIKRCTAPCVGYINPEEYQKSVEQTRLFLEGKSNEVVQTLIQEMETASENHAYERAAKLRDQIALLRSTQQQQIIIGAAGDLDIIGIVTSNLDACIHMLMIRNGQIMGSRQFFLNIADIIIHEENNPPHENSENDAKSALQSFLLETFLLQHYSEEKKDEFPKEILLCDLPKNQSIVEAILTERAGREIKINAAKRGDRVQWLKMAEESAKQALQSKIFQREDQSARFQALQESLHLTEIPERLECFDISHTFGQATIASCVVMDKNGPVKSDYRSFNIKTAARGDDYAAMRESLTRRYTRLKLEGKTLPDIIIVDGGLGQLSSARAVLLELQIEGVVLLAVAKGPLRKAGLETVYLSTNGESVRVDLNKEAFLLIQRIRDEAHRFAIMSHRKKRQKQSLQSSLENIPGIGKQRRFQILKYFGGLQEVQKASIEELSKVPGISHSIAQKIYEALHGS